MELSATVGTGSLFLANEPVTGGLLPGIVDEYDPFRPNEYEDFVKRRREQKKREKREEQRKEEEERRVIGYVALVAIRWTTVLVPCL